MTCCGHRCDQPTYGCASIHAGPRTRDAMRRFGARAASTGECTAPRVAGHAGHDLRHVLFAGGNGIRPLRPVPASGEERPRTEDRYAITGQAGPLARFIERMDT